jgi:putative aldouronate transport system substrate-binding protein
MKKTLVLLIMLFLLAGIVPVFAEGSAEELPESDVQLDENTPGWTVTNDPVRMEWYLNFSWFRGIWGEDPVSRYVTEKTGVDIEFIIPAGNEADKLNTMLASGKLPDFITLGWWEPQVKELIAGQLVYPLDVLAENYDPYFFKVANPQRLNWYTQEDGHVYSYPNASFTPDDYEKRDLPSNQTFLVRKDIYKAIGSPDMRTPEGFVSAMEKAKAMFPELNGQPIIPIGLHEFTDSGNYSLESYLMNFLAIPMEKNGKLYDRYSDPEYKRWLNAFRELNAKGLLHSDVFLDRRAQMEEKMAQGRYFAMLYQRSDMTDAQLARYNADPNSIYIAVDGPSNRNLDPPRLAGQGLSGWTVTFISKTTRNPERAIRFMSYLMSEEGQKDLFLGIEGFTWENTPQGPRLLPEVAEVLSRDRGEFDRKYGASVKYWMLMDNPMFAEWEEPPKTPFKELVDWTLPYTVSYAAYDNIDPLPFEDEGIIGSKLSALFGKTLPKLLQAKTEAEFNQIWNEFQAERRDLGLNELLAYQQQKVNQNKAKLGLD